MKPSLALLRFLLIAALLTQFAAPMLRSDAAPTAPTIPAPAHTYNVPFYHWLALPSPDGQHLFIGGSGGPFPLIDLQTGAVVTQFPADLDGWIHRAAFTPDGSALLINNTLYNPLTGAVQRAFAANCATAACAGLAISPDGAHALIVPDDAGGKTLQRWDIASGERLQTYDLTPLNPPGALRFAEISPDGRFIAISAFGDGATNAWVLDAATGVLLHSLSPIQTADFAFSPDSAYLLYGSYWGGGSSSVRRLLRTSDWSIARDFGNSSAVRSVAYAPDGSTVAFQTDFEGVAVFNPVDGSLVSSQYLTSSGAKIAYTRDSAELILPLPGYNQSAALRYTVATGQIAGALLANLKESYLRGAALAPAGDSLLLYGYDTDATPWENIYSAVLLDPHTGAFQGLLETDGHFPGYAEPGFALYRAAFSPDGAQVLLLGNLTTSIYANDGFTARLLNRSDSSPGPILLAACGGANLTCGQLRAAAFSADGALVAVADDQAQIFIFHTASGALLHTFQHTRLGLPNALAFAPDGSRLALSVSGYLLLYNPTSGALLHEIAPDGWSYLWDVAFSPDSSQLALAASDDTLRLLDAADGAPLRQYTGLHGGSIFSVQYNPEGSRLLTGGRDGRAKIWDAQTGDLLLQTAGDETAAVTWAVFGANETTLYTASAFDSSFGYTWGTFDSRVHRWNLAEALPAGREPITPILPDILYTGAVTPNNWADFSLTAAENTGGLVITATLPLSARWNAQPTQGLADFRAEQPGVSGQYTLVIPQPRPSTLFIGVTGAPPSPFSLRAAYHSRALAESTPTQAGNAGQTTLTLSGLGFEETMTVGLCQSAILQHPAAALEVLSPQTAAARFDLEGAAVGLYDLCVAWADSYTITLPGALTVASGTGPALHTELTLPAQHRPNRPYTAQLTYQNTGDSDLPAPLLLLHNSANAPAQSPCQSESYTGTLQLLGTAALGLAGSLAPGAQGQIPIRFTGSEDPAHTLVEFTVEALLPNDQLIDWNATLPAMRPPAIPLDEWEALFPALTAQLGSTWADYLSVLSANATRLGLRGAPTVCVPELLALEVDKARGQPTAAISGQALDAESGQPLRGVKIAAYRFAADRRHAAADEVIFRAETTALLDGRFILDGLSAGAYHLALDGYSLSITTPITIANDSDISGLLVYATPPLDTAETSEPLRTAPGFDPSLAVDGSGQAALAWQQGSALWTARYDPVADLWLEAAPLPGVSGDAPALAYGPAVANGNPGFILLWRKDYGNQGRLHYAVAETPSGDGFFWSAPITLTQDSFGDTAPAVSVLPDGSPLIVYLQRDWSVEDDFDLYYAKADAPLDLVFTLADEAGEVYQLRLPFSPEVEACAALTLKQGTALPKWVPVIGGRYKFEVAGETCATLGCSLGGAASGKVDVEFTQYAAGSGSISGSAGWETDPKSCLYVFDKASVTLTAGAEGKIPVGKFTVLGVDVEAGAALNGSLSGSLNWKGGTLTRLPDSGEVNLTAGLGPYGKAEIWGVEAEVKGTGSAGLKYTVPKTLEFTGFCLNFSGSAKFRIVTLSFTKSVGDSCGGALAADLPMLPGVLANSPQTRTTCVTVVRDGLPTRDCKTESVQAQQGTGNTYPGTPVLSDLSADLTHDGAARLVSTTGLPLLQADSAETLAVWTKDSPTPTMTVGSALVAAAFDGEAWSPPVEIADSAAFNGDPALTYLTAGQPLVVWARADAAGLSLSSTITEVVTAMEATEIYYSLHTSGTWSVPALLASAPGSDMKPQVTADGQGGALAAWWNVADPANSALQTAFWTGAGWDAPVTLARPAGVVDSLAVGYIVSGTQTIPLLVWAQTTDSDDATRDDLMLFYSRYVDGNWLAARPVAAQASNPPAAQMRQVETQLVSLPAMVGPQAPEWMPPVPPADCCQSESATHPIPPIPPADDPNTPALDGAQPVARAVSELIRPNDPNEKAGLPGDGWQHQVLPETRLEYTIFFENVMTATAPAQVVVVSDTLEAGFDWSSVRFEGFGFGAVSEAVGEQAPTFERVVAIPDYRAGEEKIWFVQVRGEMNSQTGLLLWTLTTLDPATNDLPEDALAGFLPPNDDSGRGQGYVAFSVAPQPALPPGILIRNRAEIVFDSENSILTNWFENLLDWNKVYLPLVRR